MPTLYTLHLSPHRRGMVKGPVRALPAPGIAGHYREAEGCKVRPEHYEVRACLPAQLRAAYDRAGSFWYPSTPGKPNDGPASLTLRDMRGGYLGTLYAQPIESGA